MIVTVSLDGGQEPLLMVHTNVFTPRDNPVTPEVGEAGLVTVELPAMTVQAPVPAVGVFPASVAVVAQTVWSVPAADVVGVGEFRMLTVSLLGVQGPLLIVQRNRYVPVTKPVTSVAGSFTSLIVAVFGPLT